MQMRPEMTPELAILQLQEDVVRIEDDLKQVRAFVTGNGDPKKGLLWLCADLGALVTTLTKLMNEQQKSLADHVAQGHPRRNEAVWNWNRLGYDLLKQAGAYIILALFVVLALGFRSWIAQP